MYVHQWSLFDCSVEYIRVGSRLAALTIWYDWNRRAFDISLEVF